MSTATTATGPHHRIGTAAGGALDPGTERVRTYGGWRERRGFGPSGLSGRASTVGLVLLIVVVVAGSLLPAAALAAVPALAVAAVLVLGRWHGQPLGHAVAGRLAWARASRAGWTTYRAGLAAVDPAAAASMPGPLASSAVLEVPDARGRPWALVWDRRSGRLTATFAVAAASTWLVSARQGDAWVGNWHGWLAKLGYAPGVSHVAVTVDTRPAAGQALADAVAPQLDPGAPDAALRIVGEVLRSAPGAAAAVDTRVSVTFDPRRLSTAPATIEEAAAEFSRLLDGLAAPLGGCGVAVLGRARAADTAAWVRSAFDPAAEGAVAAAGAHGRALTWADARPVAVQEHRDRYVHDSGTSVSWAWDEAPRQAVPADVLTRLLSPGGHRKRVTLLFTPTPAAQAARLLQEQAQAATIRAQVKRRTGRDESARDSVDRERAARAAAEEAAGAGLVDLSVYATTTVADPEQLPAAVAEVEHAAQASRIRLRRLYGSQAAGFAAGLSCGVHPGLLRAAR
jgi:hypothetical protein